MTQTLILGANSQLASNSLPNLIGALALKPELHSACNLGMSKA